MKREIKLSYQRSVEYGIDPIRRNKHQKMLSPAELSERRRQNRKLLNILKPQFDEFYKLLFPNDFIIAAVDSDGYILHIRGKDELIEDSTTRNCVPGYRWTEKDVGTTAISLTQKLKTPIQLIDDEHFCQQAHDQTSSTAPVFGKDKKLIGIIAVFGSSKQAHAHTLYMVTTAARAAEQQLRVLRRNRELAANLNFLDQTISFFRTGLIIINSEKHIWRVNREGAQILKRDDLENRPLSVLQGLKVDLDHVAECPESWTNKEVRLKVRKNHISLILTVQLVTSERGERLGAVITFNEVKDIYKLAQNIAGTRAHFTFDSILGTSPTLLETVKLAKGAASSDSTVLLQGETGTGKELFAQSIHNQSSRRNNPFIPINCGAIPSNLLESELFGYVDGTFTGAAKGGKPGKFELANTGTILLDEIGDMPYRMQVKLLRVLETGEVYRIGADKPVKVDTRIIAATHVNLPTAIRDGRFREDLYYRLNVFPIHIPPLKERGRDDILLLASLFLKEGAASPPSLSPEAQNLLASYHWPGNVRELENCIQRALHLCGGETIEVKHLGMPHVIPEVPPHSSGTLDDVVRKTIQDILKKTNNNRALTAKLLGISRATLYRKIDKYRIHSQ
ncbi:sigma-54-dependent Fis family transcriptional regulator [Desulfovibrio sp. JC022]|nr:sigma-54-dependent Fis family transcriptional regulator [Desulfovibrio sp. JC022]